MKPLGRCSLSNHVRGGLKERVEAKSHIRYSKDLDEDWLATDAGVDKNMVHMTKSKVPRSGGFS